MTTSSLRRVARTVAIRAVAVAVAAAALNATPVWAGKLTCLTGTDPVASFDRGRIAFARDMVNYWGCNCANFDGSFGTTRKDYLNCVKSYVDMVLVPPGYLRKECRSTVLGQYNKSTCGEPASKNLVPCVKRSLSSGTVSCAIKAASKCTSKASSYTQRACLPPTTLNTPMCTDVADTNDDQLINAGDSGECATAPTCGDGVREGWEVCDLPGSGCAAPYVCRNTCYCDVADATPVPTPTRTPVPPPGSTPTRTFTPVPPGSTPTRTFTPVPPTATPVPPPPTAARFVDNGDGTVTDLQTGLMWEKKDDGGGLHDKDNAYTWSSTGTAADGTAFTNFLATLNTAPCFAGHCDWRLPTSAGSGSAPTGQSAELESLLAAPYPCGTNPCVPAAFNTNCTPGCSVMGCSCTVSNLYWSGSTVGTPPVFAWAVYFNDGYVFDYVPADDGYVRAVR